jgi:hypothetical protein
VTEPVVRLLPEAPDLPYRLGAHVVHDPASRAFPARALFAAEPIIRSVEHRRRVPLYDQNGWGSCESQSGHGTLSTAPFTHRYRSQRNILRGYSEMTAADPFEGTFDWRHPTGPGSTDTGTSTLAMAQWMRRQGRIREYRWNFSWTDTRVAIQTAPLVVAFAWYPSMFRNPSRGTEPLTVDFSEGWVGGHALSATRLDVARRLIGGPNSWGSWGWWWLRWADAERLLADQGDSLLMVA